MPYKYNQYQRHQFKKGKFSSLIDWSSYNKSLKRRGDICIWLSNDVVSNWYEMDRIYDGNGTPNLYSDMAIYTCHEIRQVFKLPLRQCEGFINSLFKMLKLDLHCPDYSVLSKRLKKLHISCPYYKKAHQYSNNIKTIAIDSTGLKCFGQDEWQIEEYGLKEKKNWRKLHIVVDDNQIIQSCDLTDRLTQDNMVVNKLIKPMNNKVKQVTADKAYDTNSVYKILSKQFPSADIIIPPSNNAIYDKNNHFYRNRNLLERKYYGCMGWQKRRGYGKRNNSELAIQRYKKILGNKLHSIDFDNQKTEALIGCSILNKMTAISDEQIRLKF